MGTKVIFKVGRRVERSRIIVLYESEKGLLVYLVPRKVRL